MSLARQSACMPREHLNRTPRYETANKRNTERVFAIPYVYTDTERQEIGLNTGFQADGGSWVPPARVLRG